jgi:prophage antirepressor-like protein
VLADVCGVLHLPNVGQAASRLDEDEKTDITINDLAGRPNRSLIISESSLYSLVLKSRKPEAKRFKNGSSPPRCCQSAASAPTVPRVLFSGFDGT